MVRKRGKTVAKLLRELKGVGEKTEKLFQKIGITTTDDLLHYYPRNYDSYEAPEEIGSLKENSVVSVRGTVTAGVYVNRIRNLQVISVTVADTTGKLPVVWFNAPYLKNTLKKGSCFIFRGKISRKKGHLEMEHPEIFTMASSEREGMKLVKQTTRYLIKSGHPWLIPELVIKSGFKFNGYRLGKAYQKLPRGLVKRLSMNKSYWEK